MKFNNFIMAPEKHYLGLFFFFSPNISLSNRFQISDFSWPLGKFGLGLYSEYFEYAGGCELCYTEFHISNA